MTNKEIKAKIKEFKTSDSTDAIAYIYPEIGGTVPAHQWNDLLRIKKQIKLKPSVGDVAKFSKYYNGNATGEAYIGVVSSLRKGQFTLLVSQKEETKRVNFGATSGYVLQGFISMAIEDIKED